MRPILRLRLPPAQATRVELHDALSPKEQSYGGYEGNDSANHAPKPNPKPTLAKGNDAAEAAIDGHDEPRRPPSFHGCFKGKGNC